MDPSQIRCVVFDFGFTLSSDLYFKVAPPECPNWRALIQQHIFDQPHVTKTWMAGAITILDIAAILSGHIDLPIPVIVETMERGCTYLKMNSAVWEFACAQRAQGRRTALVTANMDVFTNVVVPSHRLDAVFDVILNTFDYRELRKEALWPRAFEMLGNGIGYRNSLLIEDGPREPALFRANGGHAYQYEGDELFHNWLKEVSWPSAPNFQFSNSLIL